MQEIENKNQSLNIDILTQDFHNGKISTFSYYSQLVKELIRLESLEKSDDDTQTPIIFERFVSLSGEEDKFQTRLMIDTHTGYLYSPKRQNNMLWVAKSFPILENHVSQIEILGFDNWKLAFKDIFFNFPPKERLKWFTSPDNRVVLRDPHFYVYYYPNWSQSDTDHLHSYVRRFFYLNKNISDTEDIGGNNREINIINKTNQREEWYHLDRNEKIYGKVTGHTPYPNSTLSNYFPNWKNQLMFDSYKYKPFICCDYFIGLDIWSENITSNTFLKFLKNNHFDIEKYLPQNSLKIRSILKQLSTEQKISLHGDKISFKSSIFESKSTISKYQNLLEYTDFLLWKIEIYNKTYVNKLKQSNNLYIEFNKLKSSNPIFIEIQQYLISHFDFSLNKLEEKLVAFKRQGFEFIENVNSFEKINSFFNSTGDFDFNFYAETITLLYNEQIDKIESFDYHIPFFTQFFEIFTDIIQNAENFKLRKEQLFEETKKEYVNDNFEIILKEWTDEIATTEKEYLPLLKSYFLGSISQDVIIKILKLLQKYTKEVDSFFLKDRIPIIHEYHKKQKSQFLEFITREQKLFKVKKNIIHEFKEIISNENRYLSKKLIHTQSQTILDTQIQTLKKFSKELNITLFEDEFRKLEEKNFEFFLEDIIQYSDELEKKNATINSLIFRMEKDLQKDTIYQDNSEVK